MPYYLITRYNRIDSRVVLENTNDSSTPVNSDSDFPNNILNDSYRVLRGSAPSGSIVKVGNLAIDRYIPISANLPFYTDNDRVLYINQNIVVRILLKFCFKLVSFSPCFHSLSIFQSSSPAPTAGSHRLGYNGSYVFCYSYTSFLTYNFSISDIDRWFEFEWRCVRSPGSIAQRVFIYDISSGSRVLRWDSQYRSNLLPLHSDPYRGSFVLDGRFDSPDDFIRVDYLRLVITTRSIFGPNLSSVYQLNPAQDHIFVDKLSFRPIGSYINKVSYKGNYLSIFDTGFNQVGYINTNEEILLDSGEGKDQWFYSTGFKTVIY